MSDPVQSFEFVLKNQNSSSSLALYRKNKTANKHTCKPQDVISIVSSQLRAIQMADSLKKNRKNCANSVILNKQSNFVCINKLPVYEQIPKQLPKFDTLCITDTQLINVIEDAEILDTHHGITQEFETAFIHNTEKNEGEISPIELKTKIICREKNDKETNYPVGNTLPNNLDIGNSGAKDSVTNEEIYATTNNSDSKDIANSQAIVSSKVFSTDSVNVRQHGETVEGAEHSIENIKDIEIQVSQILHSKIINKHKGNNPSLTSSVQNKNTEIEEHSQLLNQGSEMYDNDDLDRPLSPILHKKDSKVNSSPPPLIFSLEKFEHFERIVIPLIESGNYNSAKHIINSQLLNKELLININEDIQLNVRDISRPVIDELENVGCPVQNTEAKLIQIDKETSEEIIDQLNSLHSKKINKDTIDEFKDEILFSSDEEDCTTKITQDLPFTCALETSFYNQSDVLDKTMYVGFQTASNRSIQVCADSFAKAKNLLTDVSTDEVTVTELVQNCDTNNVFKDKQLQTTNTEVLHQLSIPKISKASSTFLGFRTASNVKISLSENALAKSKKVFQDIDLNDNFHLLEKDLLETNNCQVRNHKVDECNTSDVLQGFDDEFIQEFVNTEMSLEEDKKQNIEMVATARIPKTAVAESKNSLESINPKPDLPRKANELSIQDKIDNKSNIHVNKPSTSKGFVGFKTANNKNINISTKAWSSTKNIFSDVDSIRLPNETNKDYPKTDLIEENHRDEMYNISDHSCDDKQFDTLQSVNKHCTETAVSKELNTSHNFEIDNLIDIYQTINENGISKASIDNSNAIIHESCSKFLGFKTANNKNINISEESLRVTKNIFKDIDSPNFQMINNKEREHHSITGVETNFDPLDPNVNTADVPKLRGFKTASKKLVKVSSEALLKRKQIFQDVDSDYNFSIENNIYGKKQSNSNSDYKIDSPSSPILNLYCTTSTGNKNHITMPENALASDKQLFQSLEKQLSLDMPVKAVFSGFQTASNKQVKISEEALANSKKIFNDIDTLNLSNTNKDFKAKSLYPEEIYQHNNKDGNMQILGDTNKITQKFEGFHTANSKPVSISKSALEKIKKDTIYLDQVSSSGFQTGSNLVAKAPEIKALTEIKKVNTMDISKFQTGSRKDGESENAFAETEHVFIDIERKETRNEKFDFGFQTGNNKAVVVSKESLVKSKKILDEVDVNKDVSLLKEGKNETINIINQENIGSLIDTQIINNFYEELYTEDFRETPKKSKRSGSPILLCSRAKKRKKFETPYKLENTFKPMPKPNDKTEKEKKIIYREDYKKNKTITLKDLKEKTIKINAKIDPYLLNFKYDNLLQLEFKGDRNDITKVNMTINVIKEYFLDSVNLKLVPNHWLDNHLKLILWKLISYEVVFKSVVCTAKNVLEQLNYRYIKELYNAERPALRKILEKDDIPSKTMILCIVEIYADAVSVSSVTNLNSKIELLVTDGWYCIRCVIDKMLAELVYANKITVGCKIVTTGAELMGCDQGVSPWEDTSAVRLKIFGNSTRRARWDARLGYYSKGALLTQLSSVKVLGGKVSKLRVFVTRVYPALYVEKFEDGSTVTRSERLENLQQMKTESDRQAFMEKVYEEVEKEFALRESQDSEGLTDSYKRSCMDSGSQIAKMMKRHKDPIEFRAQLTNSQAHLLEEYNSRNHEKLLQEMQTRVRERMEKAGVCVNRNVVSLLKIRIAGVRDKEDNIEITKGMMSIWNANDAVREIVKEGAWIDVMNVVPTSIRYGEIQISAGRQSVFSTSKLPQSEKVKHYVNLLKRKCYTLKELAENPNISTDFNEIDTVGLIFLIDPAKDIFDSTKQAFQNVYLTDIDKNMICANFWGGLKKFGFQNVLDTGQIVSCVNLQKRAGNTRKSIPQYRVTELSYFTQTPRSDNSRIILEEFNKKMAGLDKRKFCQECLVLKNNYSVAKQNNENVSPYRCMNNTDFNISKNKMFIDSPILNPNKQDSFDLTGIDFDSTFKQDTQLSEEALKRRRKINEKIARLKMYGEPPPLSPMHIINRSKQASSSYKSPLLSNTGKPCNNIPRTTPSHQNRLIQNSKCNSSRNVADLKNTPIKCGEISCEISNSPVLLNKTFVKGMNPVKIDFDVKDSNDNNIDHFAEEFDGSPPLSLD